MQKKMRQEQILQAARRVFYLKGFSGATVEDIAREAELSPAAIYLYFHNKDDLYVALNLELLSCLKDRLLDLKEKSSVSPEQKLAQLSQVLHGVFVFDPLTLINLFHLQASEGLTNLPPDRSKELNDMAGQCLRTLAAIFEEGVAKGVFMNHHPIALADIVWMIFTGSVLWEESKRMINPEKDYLKPTLDLALQIFARGIARDRKD